MFGLYALQLDPQLQELKRLARDGRADSGVSLRESESFRIFSVPEDWQSLKSLNYGGRYWDRTSGPCRVKRK